MKKKGRISLIWRLALVMATLAGFVFVAQPAAAGNSSIDQIRFPAPPDYRLNNVPQRELFWWKITGAVGSTPVEMRHRVKDPDGIVIHDESWDIRSLSGNITTGIFNVENTVGQSVHGDFTQPQYSHSDPLYPAGAKPGVYTSIVDYYSAQISGSTTYPAVKTFGFDSESSITFLIRQPLRIFKYNDLDTSGNFTAGEPGLDNWHFTVTGPAGQTWSYTGSVAAAPPPTVNSFASNDLTLGFPASGTDLLVNSVHVGAYTQSGGVFTLSVAMGSPPAAGQGISTVPVSTFSGDTSGGGYLDLPNGVLIAGAYTITETLQPGWQNTDPGGPGPTYSKVVNVPGGINAADPTVYFGNTPTFVPPVPEMPAGLLFGLGLAGVGGFVFMRRRNRVVTLSAKRDF